MLGFTVHQLTECHWLCQPVTGLDYSHAFVNAGIALQEKGVLPYKYATEGRLLASSTAEVSTDIDRSRVKFMHGDACGLPKTFGAYDAVLLANLLDRLPYPRYLVHSTMSLLDCVWLCD
jgi:hypothetical protein